MALPLGKISVAIAVGPHPFPFRTRKLSPPAPMVLGGRPPGRVGRRRISQKPARFGVALLRFRAVRFVIEVAWKVLRFTDARIAGWLRRDHQVRRAAAADLARQPDEV